MKKSFIIKYLLSLVLLIASLSFLTVFGASILSQNTELVDKLSNNIYLNSDSLNKTYLVYKSNYNISDAYFQSACDVGTKFITNNGNLYLFELTINNKDCSNNVFFLKSKNGILCETDLNLISDYKLYSILLDYSTKDLNSVLKTTENLSSGLKIFNSYNTSLIDDKYDFSKKKRSYEEFVYRSNLIKTILEKRDEKYLIPVPGYQLPTNPSKIPNAGRPYRSDTTDGIHHSWDINAPYGQEVVALDDGIIVRVVNGWEMSDLDKIKEGKNLNYEDKAKNLDLLRGNQIWIKTMKGEVVMYAHLSKIADGVKTGTMVKKGDYIGNIGITGVPDSNYKDYHLDFSICENPYNPGKVGSYTIDDYMSWPWKLKGETKSYVLEHSRDFFEKN